jgi:hypothetical protein
MAISSMPGSPFYDPSWATAFRPAYYQDPRLGEVFTRPEMAETNWRYGEEIEPGAPWTAKLAQLGYGGLDPRGMWGRQLFSRAREGYAAARQQNLNLQWQDYLKNIDVNRMWAGLSPSDKGYSDAQFGGPPRWQRRA